MKTALLTMLNPRTASLEIGSGGRPTYTWEDMSKALSAIEITHGNKLGAAILCYIHAPDMAALQSPTLSERLRQLMFVEKERRVREEQKARLDYQIAKENYEARAYRSRSDDFELNRTRSRHQHAKSLLWPERGDTFKVYNAIRKSILEDLRNANICTRCKGTKQVTNADGLLIDCDKCSGTGYARMSIRKVAKLGGRSNTGFNRYWQDVYDFTYSTVNTALTDAKKQFHEVMS